MQAKTTAVILLGLAVEIPIKNYGRIVAKSEHACKYSLLILGTVIDPDFRGEICAIVHILEDKDLKIQTREEVVQLILEKGSMPVTQEVICSTLTQTQRGIQGFGSAKILQKKE